MADEGSDGSGQEEDKMMEQSSSDLNKSGSPALSDKKATESRKSAKSRANTAERLREARGALASKLGNASHREWPLLQQTFRALSDQIEREEEAAHQRETEIRRLIISAAFSAILIASGVTLIVFGNNFGLALIGIAIGLFSKPIQQVINLFLP